MKYSFKSTIIKPTFTTADKPFPNIYLDTPNGKIGFYSERRPLNQQNWIPDSVLRSLQENQSLLIIGCGFFYGETPELKFLAENRRIFFCEPVLESILQFCQIPENGNKCAEIQKKIEHYISRDQLSFSPYSYRPKPGPFVSLKLWIHPIYQRLYPKLCASWRNHITFFWPGSPSQNRYRKTIWAFSAVWWRNWWRTQFPVYNKSDYDDKFPAHKGVPIEIEIDKPDAVESQKPILILGAATSINNLWTFKDKFSHFRIWATDTTLPLLAQNNVTVDAVFSVDAGRGTLYHFWKTSKIASKKIGGDNCLSKPRAIYGWSGGGISKIWGHNPRPIANIATSNYSPSLFYSDYPLDQLACAILDRVNIHAKGGGVIGQMLQYAAIEFPGNPVYILGMGDNRDFWSVGSHFSGSAYEDYRLNQCDRLRTLEQQQTRYFAPSINLENIFNQYPDAPFYPAKIVNGNLFIKSKPDSDYTEYAVSAPLCENSDFTSSLDTAISPTGRIFLEALDQIDINTKIKLRDYLINENRWLADIALMTPFESARCWPAVRTMLWFLGNYAQNDNCEPS